MRIFVMGLLCIMMAACQMQPAAVDSDGNHAQYGKQSLKIEAPFSWGGEARCSNYGCFLGLVEHENNLLALHRVSGDEINAISKIPVGYHPDSAFWINDNFLIAAVEFSQSLDIFKFNGNKLDKFNEYFFSFRARNGLAIEKKDGSYALLAVPYSGTKVGWANFHPDGKSEGKVVEVDWCEAPWHPAVVDYFPGEIKKAVVVACRGDGRIIAAPIVGENWPIKVLAQVQSVPRQVRPSPKGDWLYISLEINGNNARINMHTGEIQNIKIPGNGSFTVVPITENLIAWGVSGKVYLQKIDSMGMVIEQRFLRTSGFSSDMKKYDINKDGFDDLIVFNSNNEYVDVLYGPLWSRAEIDAVNY